MAYDPANQTLYVGGDTSIQAVNPANGAPISTLPGTYGHITMMSFGHDGYIYASDYNNQVIDKVDPVSGLVAKSYSFPASERTRAVYADDESVNEDIYVGGDTGTLYEIDQAAATVKTLSLSGTLPNAVGGVLFQDGSPATLYVADTNGDRILQYLKTGSTSYAYNATETAGGFIFPHQLLQGPGGDIYLVGTGQYLQYDANFNFLRNCLTSTWVGDPQGMAVDPQGGAYIGSELDGGALLKMNGCADGPAAPVSIPSGTCYVYPSPVRNGHATLAYDMGGSGKMEMVIWNQNREKVADVTDHKPAGSQTTAFSLSGFSPGVYLYLVTLSYDSGSSVKLKPGRFAVIP